jgi:flagellar hook-associated protein 2
MATSSISSTSGSTSTQVSTDVYNRVEQAMASQSKAAAKINTSITKDQTKLSALASCKARWPVSSRLRPAWSAMA